MASGFSGSKGFDFASDDILCSYDHQNPSSNGAHIDSSKGFQKNLVSRSSVFPTASAYGQPEESLSQEMVAIVERTMKKYTDNLMRFLEGISSRLSELELYCYNLDKLIGEMRSELARDNGEADSKLKFIEKHLQEVHRSVQILRDKQELAETQKELAKLQLAQKESSPPAQDERTTASASETEKNEDASEAPNTQLALALPGQIPQQPTHPAVQQQPVAPPQPSSQALSQHQSYYMPSNQLTNPQTQPHLSYLAADAQYRVAPIAPQAPPQPSQNQVNQTSNQQFAQYQPQWPQQVTQPMQLPQQPSIQPPQQLPMQPSQQAPMQPQNQMRAPSPPTNLYLYMAGQPANAHPEGISSSMSMQMPFPGIPQPGANRSEVMPYGYGGPSRPVQPQPQPPPPHMKPGFPSAPGDGYASGGPQPPISSAGSYMLYDGGDGSRSHHPTQPTQYSQSGYPPSNPLPPNMAPPGNMIRNPAPGRQQYAGNHPCNELIDKLVSMGYRGDHVVSVIQRLDESGQAVDFNAVLDRLNGHSSGSPQRSW